MDAVQHLSVKVDGEHPYTITYFSTGQWLIEVGGCVAGRVAVDYWNKFQARFAKGPNGQARDDSQAMMPPFADRDAAAEAVAAAYFARFVQTPSAAQVAA